jgi:hypothetical protein
MSARYPTSLSFCTLSRMDKPKIGISAAAYLRAIPTVSDTAFGSPGQGWEGPRSGTKAAWGLGPEAGAGAPDTPGDAGLTFFRFW